MMFPYWAVSLQHKSKTCLNNKFLKKKKKKQQQQKLDLRQKYMERTGRWLILHCYAQFLFQYFFGYLIFTWKHNKYTLISNNDLLFFKVLSEGWVRIWHIQGVLLKTHSIYLSPKITTHKWHIKSNDHWVLDST